METKRINPSKITPCLWFNNNAEEAVKYYLTIFKNSKEIVTTCYGKNAPMPEGSVLTIKFQLEGQDFLALNGGPTFTFSEAISFIVNCETQKEIDEFWNKLSAGGTTQQCGWLKDKFGVSWQIVPVILNEMIQDSNTERSNRVMQALMQMVKIDIEKLKTAYRG